MRKACLPTYVCTLCMCLYVLHSLCNPTYIYTRTVNWDNLGYGVLTINPQILVSLMLHVRCKLAAALLYSVFLWSQADSSAYIRNIA